MISPANPHHHGAQMPAAQRPCPAPEHPPSSCPTSWTLSFLPYWLILSDYDEISEAGYLEKRGFPETTARGRVPALTGVPLVTSAHGRWLQGERHVTEDTRPWEGPVSSPPIRPDLKYPLPPNTAALRTQLPLHLETRSDHSQTPAPPANHFCVA